MNRNAMLSGLMAVLMVIGVVGTAQAMGDKTPNREARPEWVRPGDLIAEQEAKDRATAQDAQPATVPDAAPADGPQVFLPPEGSPMDWQWKARLVVVFADTPNDQAYRRQIAALERGVQALRDRDARVVVDTDPAANSDWRRILRPEGFGLVLIDKDGTVMLRKPVPWDMREISRAIDRFPQRRQELGRSGMQP